MTDQDPAAPTLGEVALVAGTTRAAGRAAASQGVLREDDLSWVDALALRVFSTVTSMRFPGDPQRRARDMGNARAMVAAGNTREEAEADRMAVTAQLVVTRDRVKLASDLTAVYLYLDQDLSGLETAQVLPVGRWWYEMRWRMGVAETALAEPAVRR